MRLIDADVLEPHEQLEAMGNGEYEYVEVVYKDDIDDVPTIDAVPVVRCKDCKHRDPEDKKCDCGHDILWQLPRADEWFCADGERGDSE